MGYMIIQIFVQVEKSAIKIISFQSFPVLRDFCRTPKRLVISTLILKTINQTKIFIQYQSSFELDSSFRCRTLGLSFAIS